MKLLIAIPSKNRSEVLLKNALSWAREFKETVVFVEPQDYDLYSDPYYMGIKKIVSIGQNNKGLGYAKTFIKKFAEENGYSHVFKVDDDIKGFTHYRKQVTGPAVVDWIKQVISDAEKAFADTRVGGVAFPYSFEMFEKEGWSVTKRMQTAYIVPTELLHADEKISVFEDFAQGLYIMTQGRLIVKHGLAGIAMGVAVGKGVGGHQSFDRKPQALKEVEELRKIYPPLGFRAVDKPWGIEPDLTTVKLLEKL